MIGKRAPGALRSLLVILSLILVAAVPTVDVFAQQEDPCPELANHPQSATLLQEFMKSRLKIAPTPAAKSRMAQFPEGTDYGTLRHWCAYRDSRPMTEEAFFHACGLEYEASKARGHIASANRRMSLGMTGTVVGGIVWLVAAFVGATSKGVDWPLPTLAAGVVLTGTSWYVMHTGVQKRMRTWVPCERAMEAADAYNEELCRSLAGQRSETGSEDQDR